MKLSSLSNKYNEFLIYRKYVLYIENKSWSTKKNFMQLIYQVCIEHIYYVHKWDSVVIQNIRLSWDMIDFINMWYFYHLF